MRARRATLGVVALLLSGCTAIPSHSSPQTISFIPQNPSVVPSANPPTPGASPREIVSEFLRISALEAGAQSSSRDYLTRAARAQWQDASVTILDSISVGLPTPPGRTITVTGRPIGTVDDQGIFQPNAFGIGNGGPEKQYTFRIKKVAGQNRIDGLPNTAQGLLLSLDQFRDLYTSHTLEFFDLARRYLVPDLRYSPLHGADLAEWLIGQLAAGPRAELKAAVTASPLPSLADRNPVTQVGGVTRVEVPGSTQLEGTSRYRLAAQLSRTLLDVIGNGLMSITDGGTPIEIPRVNSSQFVANQFENVAGPAPPAPELYYLRDGRVVNAKGQSLPGTGVDGTRTPLLAVALSNWPLDSNSLSVAGTAAVGNSSARRLYVGNQQVVRSTDVVGPLSRPAWAPGRTEVWIGDGPALYRLVVSGVAAQRFRVPLDPGVNGAPVTAVRISPDGSRVALVLGLPGHSRLYEGAIVRSGGQVSVDTLTPISPVGVAITDVAWNGPLKLFAIGYLRSNGTAKVFEAYVDGSGWTLSLVPLLPDGPNSLTITANALAWVEVKGTVWEQSGSSTWVSPSKIGTGQVPGRNPVYLE